MLFATGPFRPGVVTQAQADELNRLWSRLAALEKIGAVPPATVTRGPIGQPIIGFGAGSADGSFWAEITGSGGSPVAYSWKKVELDPSGNYVDVDPAVEGDVNAYAVPFDGAAADVTEGDVVRMWPSRTRGGSFEFDATGAGGGDGRDVKGKLDGTLSYQGSATVSVWAVVGGVETDTTEDVTAHDWLLSTGQALTAGTQVWLGWDSNSNRYYVVSSQGCG